MCPVVLDVHLVQSSLGGGVLHCDRPVQVVRDQRLGRFPRRHQDLACKRGAEPTSEKKVSRHEGQTAVPSRRLTGDFALAEGERDHHVEGPEAAAVHAAPGWIVFVRRHLEEDERDTVRGRPSSAPCCARETHAAAATAQPRTLAPSWEVEVQSRRGGG